MVKSEQFFQLLANEFPELKNALQDEDNVGLYHVQMFCFTRVTQKAIDSGDVQLLKKYFIFADHYFRNAEPELKNAFYVSYLEHLNFEGKSKKGFERESAKKLMPISLAKGFKEINDYLDELFSK